MVVGMIMASSFAKRLQQIRHRQFVGRSDELARFQSAMSAPEPSFYLLHIVGPGGIGKTSLLHEFAYSCQEAGQFAYYMDGMDIEPTPPGFVTSLKTAMNLPETADPLTTLATHSNRTAILVDQFEYIAPLLVLSQTQFETAVREALRFFTQPEQLTNNPLLRSQLIQGHQNQLLSTSQRVQQLQQLIHQVTNSLQSTPRTMKWYRAVYHTYLQPAPTQEQAAEQINVPYGSYRRHLRAGVEHIIDALWRQEIGN